MSYIKQKDETGSATIGGTIANEQVAFGSAADTIEGTNDFKYVKSEYALKIVQDDSGLLVGAGGSNFDSDYYFQVYGAETRVDSKFPIRIKSGNADAKFITECNEARTGGQNVGEVQFKGLDSASSVEKYGQIQVDVESNTAGSRTSSMLFKVAKSDGTFPEIVRFTGGGVVIGNPDDGNEYTLPMADGSNGQVLQTDGNGNVTFQNASGGGGMVPRAQAYQSTNSYQEILGLTSGINIEQSSVNTTSNWNNTTARWRPHCFSEDGALGPVNVTLVTNSITSGTRTVNFGIWNMNADGRITTKKCTTKIEITSGTSTGQVTSDAWTAEAGQDTNVTGGQWYWIAFDASGGSGSVALAFFNSARVHCAGVKFDGTNTTFFQTLYELFADVTTTGDDPTVSSGDASGTSWIIAVSYTHLTLPTTHYV